MLVWRQKSRQLALGRDPYHVWPLPNGTVWTEFYRTPEGYLVRFPELADFEVSADGSSVACTPEPDVPRTTTEHLYLNQVLPLVQGRRGRLVFHASAVEIDGMAVALVGASGRGKSTLAAGFGLNGGRILADDGMALTVEDGRFVVQPAHPSIRLWDDSEAALGLSDGEKTPPPGYTKKMRLLGGGGLCFCREPRALRGAYFLGDGVSDAVSFRVMTGREAVIGWVKHAFLLDHEEHGDLAGHFSEVAALANSVPHFHLDFPRRFDDLSRVCDAIRDHALGKGGTR